MRAQDLTSIQLDLRHGSPARRRQQAELWTKPLNQEIARCRSAVAACIDRFHDAWGARTGLEPESDQRPHQDPEASRKAFWLRIGAAAFLGIEALLAVAVTSWALAVWPVLGGLIGGVVSVAWTLGSAGVHYGRSDADNPTLAMPALVRKVWGGFLLSLLALAGLLFARSEPSLAFVVGLATAVASLSLSSLSACLWVLAMQVDWAAPYVRKYEDLTREQWVLEQLLQEARAIAVGEMPYRSASTNRGSAAVRP